MFTVHQGEAPVRTLHLSAYDLMGGAAKAAFRLHCALVDAGEDSLMLVRQKDSERADVLGPEGWVRKWGTKVQRRAERLLVIPRATEEFSVGSLPDGLARRVRELRPDVLHVHWVSHGFLRLETLAELGIPIVWTMHDMWAFTGGCHYAGMCERYREGCGHCPVLESSAADDASRRGVVRRKTLLASIRMKLVAPSQWMGWCASQSAALVGADVRVIPYTLNTKVFAPRDREQVRRDLGLPAGKFLVLAGAVGMDAGARKGSSDFRRALMMLRDVTVRAEAVEVLVFGTASRRRHSLNGITIHDLGYISEEARLADLYAAADVFVAPSRQDNLPNTVMEAMACGTPVIGSRVGGIPDMVEDAVNGFLMSVGNAGEMAHAIARLLNDDVLRAEMGRAAREKVLRCYAPGVVTAAYRALYAECGGRS